MGHYQIFLSSPRLMPHTSPGLGGRWGFQLIGALTKSGKRSGRKTQPRCYANVTCSSPLALIISLTSLYTCWYEKELGWLGDRSLSMSWTFSPSRSLSLQFLWQKIRWVQTRAKLRKGSIHRYRLGRNKFKSVSLFSYTFVLLEDFDSFRCHWPSIFYV